MYRPTNPENDPYILTNYCKNEYCNEPTQNPNFCSTQCMWNYKYNMTTE